MIFITTRAYQIPQKVRHDPLARKSSEQVQLTRRGPNVRLHVCEHLPDSISFPFRSTRARVIVYPPYSNGSCARVALNRDMGIPAKNTFWCP